MKQNLYIIFRVFDETYVSRRVVEVFNELHSAVYVLEALKRSTGKDNYILEKHNNGV